MPGREHRNPPASVDIDTPLDTVWAVMVDTDRDDGLRVRGVAGEARLVRGTRWQRLSQIEGDRTRYETVEEFSGPLVPLAGPARVEDGFRRHAEALKQRAEELSRPSG